MSTPIPMTWIDPLEEARKRIAVLEAQLAEARSQALEALTPSAATKAAYIGEFSFYIDEQGDDQMCEVTRKVDVPWTTIKEIMAAIRDRALSQRGAE